MKSNSWLNRQKKDIFIKDAKSQGYISRAAFKLIEIENKYNLISKSNNILELGASPGSWTQVLCQFNIKNKIDCIDLIDMKFYHKNINFIKKDFNEFDFIKNKKNYDLILSDLAPNTIGHASTDHLRIIELIKSILDLIDNILIDKGNFVFKIWKGSEEKELIINLKKKFKNITYFKPNSSRKESSEIYIIAREHILKI